MLSTFALTLFLSLSSSTVINAARLPAIPLPDNGQTLSRRGALCDGAGYDLGKNAYFYLEDSNLATKWACADHCRADPKCKAFAIGKGACLHYDVNVEDNSRADNSSPWSFFDRTCLVTQSSAFVAPPSAPQTTQPSNPQPATPVTTTPAAVAGGSTTTTTAAAANGANPAPVIPTTGPVRVITTDAPLSSEFSVPVHGGVNAHATTTNGGTSPTGISQSSNSDGNANKVSTSGSGSGTSSTDTNDASSLFKVGHGLVVSGVLVGIFNLLA